MCALGLQVWRELLGTEPTNASVRRRHRIAEEAEEGKLRAGRKMKKCRERDKTKFKKEKRKDSMLSALRPSGLDC